MPGDKCRDFCFNVVFGYNLWKRKKSAKLLAKKTFYYRYPDKSTGIYSAVFGTKSEGEKMIVLGKDHILKDELRDALKKDILACCREKDELSEKDVKSILLTFNARVRESEFALGTFEVVDKRILPFTIKRLLSLYQDVCRFTDLKDVVDFEEFQRVTDIPNAKMILSENIISAARKDYSKESSSKLLVRVDKKIADAIRKGKTLRYIAYRKLGNKLNLKEEDICYFDEILKIENRELQRAYYFGVW